MQAAKAAGAMVSFDLNFREKLWSVSGAAAGAQSVMGRIVNNVDVLVGNEEDLQRGLGMPGPEAGAKSKLDPIGIHRHDRSGAERFPHIKVLPPRCGKCTRPTGTPGPRWPGLTAVRTFLPFHDLDVYDRVGGGDGFFSGFVFGLLTGESRKTQ